jgi:hypothetical protein
MRKSKNETKDLIAERFDGNEVGNPCMDSLGGVDALRLGAMIRSGRMQRLQDVFLYIAPAELACQLGMDAQVLIVLLKKNVGKITREHTELFARVFQIEELVVWNLLMAELKKYKREEIRKRTVISLYC